MDADFLAATRDICENKQFQRLGEFQHHDATILDHSLKVAVLAYKTARLLGLDWRAAARGGLLHDFFLYNWRTERIVRGNKRILHGFIHPTIALETAEKEFILSPKERDSILKHMWPLTWPFVPGFHFLPPLYPESWIVNLADIFVSLRETRQAVFGNCPMGRDRV